VSIFPHLIFGVVLAETRYVWDSIGLVHLRKKEPERSSILGTEDQKRVILRIGKFHFARYESFHLCGDPEETLVFGNHAWTQSTAENRQRAGQHTLFLDRANAIASVTPHLLTDSGVDAIHTRDDVPFV
jgi:hypothetical protein